MAYLSNYTNNFQPEGDSSQRDYYKGNQFGNYQFTSLDDVINQFMVAYVGEDKMISKISRTDVQFHAMRALQELSFDTFKSIKSQQIELPPSLTMRLPHDYVNYTKLSWADSAGIKHPLYPTKDTSNPFQVRQTSDKESYQFAGESEEVADGGFSVGDFSHWMKFDEDHPDEYYKSEIIGGELVFSHCTRPGFGADPAFWGHVVAIAQPLDVSDKDYLTLEANALAVDYETIGATNPGALHPGILRIGITSSIPSYNTYGFNTASAQVTSPNKSIDIFDVPTVDGAVGYVEYLSADFQATKEINNIDVRDHNIVWITIVSFNDFPSPSVDSEFTLKQTNKVNSVSVTGSPEGLRLMPKAGNETESDTWKNYKSTTPSENNNDDYEDDTYWPMKGNRYGIDPQHAQVNGSFYIDQRFGKIHFSSNISGKSVILDYISDSLGTAAEMQVHKFAEEAMYKWLMHAVLSTRANVPEYQVNRLKKERRAAIRQSKLRLSNVKLEEITQILRGKSKQIKH